MTRGLQTVKPGAAGSTPIEPANYLQVSYLHSSDGSSTSCAAAGEVEGLTADSRAKPSGVIGILKRPLTSRICSTRSLAARLPPATIAAAI
jgi:hypothetical protein